MRAEVQTRRAEPSALKFALASAANGAGGPAWEGCNNLHSKSGAKPNG